MQTWACIYEYGAFDTQRHAQQSRDASHMLASLVGGGSHESDRHKINKEGVLVKSSLVQSSKEAHNL
jgi:hypothetical protein